MLVNDLTFFFAGGLLSAAFCGILFAWYRHKAAPAAPDTSTYKKLCALAKQPSLELSTTLPDVANQEKIEAVLKSIDERFKEYETREYYNKEMIANLSHDLRSPLTSLIGYLDSIVADSSSPLSSTSREKIEIAQKSALTLKRLVLDLYDMNRMRTGTFKPNLQHISLSDLVSDLIAELSLKAQSKKVILQFPPPAEVFIIKADPLWIERAVRNIAENAIYYTPEGGVVEITLMGENKEVHLAVRDSGIGIPEKDVAHIFDEFFRVNKDRSRTTGGSGLGLTIAKKIILAHGGVITLSSVLGSGTKVTVSIPTARNSLLAEHDGMASKGPPSSTDIP